MMFGIALTSHIYANEFKVGFAELPITPELIDEWEDINNDAQFDPDIDKWTDVNGNNQFDAVWMAGFQNKVKNDGLPKNTSNADWKGLSRKNIEDFGRRLKLKEISEGF